MGGRVSATPTAFQRRKSALHSQQAVPVLRVQDPWESDKPEEQGRKGLVLHKMIGAVQPHTVFLTMCTPSTKTRGGHVATMEERIPVVRGSSEGCEEPHPNSYTQVKHTE